MKDDADFEAWREQRDRRQYQDAKNIRAQWDSMGGLNHFLTGPLWTDDSTIDATGDATQKEAAVPARAPRVYVASSKKRNPFYQPLVARMRAAGYEIHDWSNPPLRWEDIDPNYKEWTIARHIAELCNPASPARLHYLAYCKAIVECDAFALLLPAGTDAHCEAVMASMLGKPIVVCFADGRLQRELIHCRFWLFTENVDELMATVATVLTDPGPYYQRNPSLLNAETSTEC
jgi:hypothetical protein